MCGIVGYTGPNLEIVKRAHALQSHRGPDDAGFFSDNCVSLGHNRLAIIDLDRRSAQPMWDTAHQYCVVFNGEIYNYRELKETLLTEYAFQTESDTEVLLALYKKYGPDMCTRLRGMYAFVVYNRTDGSVFMARDSFGIKPLYYAYQNGTLYFASEMKSMVSMFGANHLPLEIDHESIQVYLTLGYTIAPHTIYKGISLLEPGTTVQYDTRTKEEPVKKSIPALDARASSQKECSELIQRTILSNLVADVPVGVFFSGGIDSSLIAATLHEHGLDLETFSVKVSGRDADTYYFEKIARELKLKENIFTFDSKAFDDIYPEVVSKLDNPSGSDSIFQSYFIARKARDKAKVVLLGDGGDELFGGYPRSFPLFEMDDVRPDRGLWLEWLYFALPRFYGKNYVFLNVFKWFGSPISYYMNAMSTLRDDSNPVAWRICRKHIKQRSIPPSQFDIKLYLGDGLLFKNDAATSYCSIEGRVPFLDSDVLSISHEQVRTSAQTGIEKYALKKMLEAYLPSRYVYRKKSGFGISYVQILRESKHLARDYRAGLEGLRAMDITVPINKRMEEKYPQISVVIATLWHSLENNKKTCALARESGDETVS